MFRLMPPLAHDANPERSQVLEHIAENLGGDLGRAVAAFNSMRHPKSRVVVFDHIHRQWKGCDWTPADTVTTEQMIVSEHRAFERKQIAIAGVVKELEANLEKLLRRVEKLERKERKELMEMADQSEASDKPSKNGFLEKKDQDRLEQKQKQPTLEEQQARALAAAMNLHNQPPVVPYVRPKMTSSGPQTTVSGPKRVWREDSGDGYAETIQNHWQEA
jgi:hypothetical protein